MEIIVRPARTEDELRGRAYVHWKAWQEAYAGLIDPEYLKGHTLEKSLERALTWTTPQRIALDGGRVVGFVSFGPARDEEGAGEVYALYVLAEYYGRGVGARLLDAALDELRDFPRILLWVLRENGRAVRFYEKHGFRADGAQMRLESLDAVVCRMTRGRVTPPESNNIGPSAAAEKETEK